jgi:hypothetical protein
LYESERSRSEQQSETSYYETTGTKKDSGPTVTYNENSGKVTVTGTGQTETGDYETGSYEDETEAPNTYEERVMGRGKGGKGRDREDSQSYSQSRTERSGTEYSEEETTQRSRR